MPPLIRLHWTDFGKESRQAVANFSHIDGAARVRFFVALDQVINAWSLQMLQPPFLLAPSGSAAVKYPDHDSEKYINVNWKAEKGDSKEPDKVLYVKVLEVWDSTPPAPSAPAT
jgi:hypothetical protein